MGEPGVGKTRLLLEIFPDAQVLRCIEGLEGLSYAPLIAWADLQFSQKKAERLGVYAEDIGRVVPKFSRNAARPDPESGKMRLFEAFARLLELEPSPVLFDDLQWCDPATLEFLTFFLTRAKTRCLASPRQHETSAQLEQHLSAWQVQRVVLLPLSLADSTLLLSSLIDSKEVYPVFAEFLYRHTAGNPFFMLEIIRDLFLRGALRVAENNWKSALDGFTLDYSEFIVPSHVEELILSRVVRLSEPTKRLLGAASVLKQIDHQQSPDPIAQAEYQEAMLIAKKRGLEVRL